VSNLGLGFSAEDLVQTWRLDRGLRMGSHHGPGEVQLDVLKEVV